MMMMMMIIIIIVIIFIVFTKCVVYVVLIEVDDVNACGCKIKISSSYHCHTIKSLTEFVALKLGHTLSTLIYAFDLISVIVIASAEG